MIGRSPVQIPGMAEWVHSWALEAPTLQSPPGLSDHAFSKTKCTVLWIKASAKFIQCKWIILPRDSQHNRAFNCAHLWPVDTEGWAGRLYQWYFARGPVCQVTFGNRRKAHLGLENKLPSGYICQPDRYLCSQHLCFPCLDRSIVYDKWTLIIWVGSHWPHSIAPGIPSVSRTNSTDTRSCHYVTGWGPETQRWLAWPSQ